MKLQGALFALGETSKVPPKAFNPVEIFQKVRNEHGITEDLPVRTANKNFNHAKGVPKANTSPEKALMFCKEHTGAADATVSLLGEGGQGVVYNCSSASTNFEAAEKLYRYPSTLDLERMRVVDQAMSDTGNGPIYYGTIEEDFPPAYVNFYELLYGETIDKIEELRPADIDVYRAAAKRFATMHIVTEEDCPRPITNCYHTWPWNTRAIQSHYDTSPKEVQEWVDDRIGANPVHGPFLNITTGDGLIEFMYDVQWGTISPTVWAHNDAHDGNVFIRDAEPGTSMEERLMLIDFDNSEFGTRAWDLAYYAFRFYEKFNNDIYEDFLNAYLREYNRIGIRQFSYKELEQEMTCMWPYLLMEQAVFYKTIGVDADFCNFMFDVMQEMLLKYADGSASCPWTGRYSGYPKCNPPA